MPKKSFFIIEKIKKYRKCPAALLINNNNEKAWKMLENVLKNTWEEAKAAGGPKMKSFKAHWFGKGLN